MNPEPNFWAGKRVCVTGGTGFLGWHLVRQLLPLAAHVRVFGLRPHSPSLCAQLQRLDCVFGDIRDANAVREAVRDCQVVFHTAGTVAVWGPALSAMREIHAAGTEQVLRVLPTGARLVHTSSVVAVGATRRAAPMTESMPFNLQALDVDYVHAKKAAEDLALGATARGVDVVAVNPAYLIGPEDYELSVMGRLCQRFWNGRMPLVPPWELNFVDVRDVARGHLLAAEKGQSGQRYILGGANGSIWEFAKILAELQSKANRWRLPIPSWAQSAFAWIKEHRARFTLREPYPSQQFARMCLYRWHYSSARAQAELGYRARPVRESVYDIYHWFHENGLLKPNGGATPGKPAGQSVRQAA